MTFNESTLVAGNSTLRSYEKGGVNFHAEGIPTFYRFMYTEQSGQQNPINFKMPDNLHLISCWFKVIDNPIEPTHKVSISVADWAGTGSFAVEMFIQPFALGDFIAIELPFIVMPKGFWLAITPKNFTLSNLMIFGKPIHLQPDMVGSKY